MEKKTTLVKKKTLITVQSHIARFYNTIEVNVTNFKGKISQPEAFVLSFVILSQVSLFSIYLRVLKIVDGKQEINKYKWPQQLDHEENAWDW